MSIQAMLKQHGTARVYFTTKNSNGTAWLYSSYTQGALAKYQVLIADASPQDYIRGITLAELYSQADVLEVSCDGVVIY